MAIHPVPPEQRDGRLKLAEQGQSPSENLLSQFIAALQQEPQADIQSPKPIGVGDRLFLALKGARDQEFQKRVVEPLIEERATFPTRVAEAQESARRQKVKELGSAIGQVGQFNLRGERAATEESKRTANLARAQKAFQAGGKPYKFTDIQLPDGSPGIEWGIIDPTTGDRIVLGTRAKSKRGVVITNERGLQTLQDPYVDPGGPGGQGGVTGGSPGGKTLQTTGIPKPISPGIQRDVAQNISTIDGFAALKQAYAEIASSGTQYGRMGREFVGEFFPRIQEKDDPRMSIFVATRRAALNRYIKAVTGAQFSIKELERYEAQLPGAGADAHVADVKIRLLADQAIATFKVLVAQNGGLDAIAADPELMKQLGIISLDVGLARKALGLDAGPSAAQEGTVAQTSPTGSQPPPEIPPESTFAGKSRSTGKIIWRLPSGKLWRER